MNEQTQEALSLIREVEENPTATQRAVSRKLGISLGKTNYLLRALIQKGIIKSESFSANPGKMEKISYLLTPKGLKEKLRLTYHFLKVKETEYKRLQEEWNAMQGSSLRPEKLIIKYKDKK